MYVKQGPLWIAVEVKKQGSFDLLHQALRHLKHAHYTYVAIPSNKASFIGICEKLGVGVMVKGSGYDMREWKYVAEAKYNRRITPYRVLDRMKLAVAGVQHNTESEFKVTISMISNLLARNGGKVLIKELFEKNRFHYSNARSARQCIVSLCRSGAIKEFEIDGKYFINSRKA